MNLEISKNPPSFWGSAWDMHFLVVARQRQRLVGYEMSKILLNVSATTYGPIGTCLSIDGFPVLLIFLKLLVLEIFSFNKDFTSQLFWGPHLFLITLTVWNLNSLKPYTRDQFMGQSSFNQMILSTLILTPPHSWLSLD